VARCDDCRLPLTKREYDKHIGSSLASAEEMKHTPPFANGGVAVEETHFHVFAGKAMFCRYLFFDTGWPPES